MERTRTTTRTSDGDLLAYPRTLALFFGAGGMVCFVGALAEARGGDRTSMVSLVVGGAALSLAAVVFWGGYALQLHQRRALGETVARWRWMPACAGASVFIGVMGIAIAGSLGITSLVLGQSDVQRRCAVAVGVSISLLAAGSRMSPKPKPSWVRLLFIGLGCATLFAALVLLVVLL